MARDRASKLQILSGQHKDILRDCEKMFEVFRPLRSVQEMIASKYGEEVGLTAILTYRNKHWILFQEMVREQKAAIKAIAEIIGEDGLTDGVNALLWQSLQAMTPPQLVAFKKVLNDTDKVSLMKKQLALHAAEHRAKKKDSRARGKNAEDGSHISDAAEDYARAQRVAAQVKEIFGIGMSEIEPPSLPAIASPATEENAGGEVVPAQCGEP